MSNQRDDFPFKIKKVLAERVAYRCSNPDCRKHTIGPSEIAIKSTSIGVAAHITAAAPGGPRYNPACSSAERADISNGIWLCANCSVLIDKDCNRYTISSLYSWKAGAELEAQRLLASSSGQTVKRPKIRCELVYVSSSSSNNGHIMSYVNYDRIVTAATPMSCSAKWSYSLRIINNSTIPAFNFKIEQTGEKELLIKSRLNVFTNLAPLAERQLECEFKIDYISTGSERLENDKATSVFPEELNDICLELSYEDENGNELKTIMVYDNGTLINSFV